MFSLTPYLVHRGCGQSFLIFAKSRIPPAQGMTIPRLELIAALISSGAIAYVHRHLQPLQLSENCPRILRSDSKVVLQWIANPGNHGRFVDNRHTEIRNNKLVCRYVPADDNLADAVSRRCSPRELLHHPLWWKGPLWLCKDPSEWPKRK
ncbi:unnamed protein product [Toxocara canis]|uniref:Protein kinase domain-containing protein n=1 Tax=Toxocara canis TaxID=6265 RepID=A0A183UEJ8_TOXCA|nr:unnamed protein product [Toxocara canis]